MGFINSFKEEHVYILYQIMNQVWVVIWLILLVVLFKNWTKLGPQKKMPREGWDEAFKLMHGRGEDKLI